MTRGLSFDPDLRRQVPPARIAIELEVARATFQSRTPDTVTEPRRTLEERERLLPDRGPGA